jgi:hypothetical protein
VNLAPIKIFVASSVQEGDFGKSVPEADSDFLGGTRLT